MFSVQVADSRRARIGVLEVTKEASGWYRVSLDLGTIVTVVYVSPHDGRLAFCDRSANG